MKYFSSFLAVTLFFSLTSVIIAQIDPIYSSDLAPADRHIEENTSPQILFSSENAYQDSTIIYTVEYGDKPASPPSLIPVFMNNYLSFENVYVVTDNWYYASPERADSVDADAFLIKGGSTSDVPFYDGSLNSYIELLKNPGRPAFGFCAGHQFLQMAQGSICARRSGEQGYQTADIHMNDEIFNGSPNPYTAWAAHSFSIVDIPDCYQNYATTRTCYNTFVKHITMPLYGTQLHIESTYHPSTAGPVILGNFRNKVMQRKFHGVSEVSGFPDEPGKVKITWWKAKSVDSVLYQIFHSTEEGALNFDFPDYETYELEYEITGLEPDSVHYFAVRALSSAFEDSNEAIFPFKPDGHHEIVFQNGLEGYDGCEATVIYHNYPNSNYGLRGSTAVDTLYWWDSGLVQFRDLEQHLAGKRIIGGKLTFIFAGGVENTTNSSHVANIGIYKILKNWNEGQGRNHADAQTGEVTWNSARHNIETWEVPGCKGNSDRAADPVAAFMIKGDGTGISFDGTVNLPAELIQTWIDHPDSNCGILFEKADTYPNDRYFYFADNDDEWFMNHPRLTVYYLDDTTTAIASEVKAIPANLTLYQNYPNPFNPRTTIEFELPMNTEVTLKIYNILGEEVATLLSDFLLSGSYEFQWDAGKYASGVYYYRLQAGDYVETKKMVLMR
ncbi:MAG: T9SS type A sorting domain-containing protein [Calditrichaeota bacterium]|nr:T9SS type A sorting domain-containing protein [Calditrichota bacterium]